MHKWQKLEKVNEYLYLGRLFNLKWETNEDILINANAGKKAVGGRWFVVKYQKVKMVV